MRMQPDSDGRYPMDIREYSALCMFVGTVHALEAHREELKDRLKLIPGGWRDMQLITTLADKLFKNVLGTVPVKKLKTMQRELPHMICETKINPALKNQHLDDVIIGLDALKKIVDRAMSIDCWACDKNKCDGRKCDLFKDVDACFPFELVGENDNKCPLAGRLSL